MSPGQKIPVTEYNTILTTPVDCVVKITKVGGITHIVFAETRPASYGTAGLERSVMVRMAVPSNLVTLMARTILAGVTTRDWIMPDEEDTAELRTH